MYCDVCKKDVNTHRAPYGHVQHDRNTNYSNHKNTSMQRVWGRKWDEQLEKQNEKIVYDKYNELKGRNTMKKIFEFWWSNGNKVFQAMNYRKAWKEIGNKPRLCLHHNGAKRGRGDSCLDISLIVGYTVILYTNFNLQRRKCNG